jgi:hypothetical protein
MGCERGRVHTTCAGARPGPVFQRYSSSLFLRAYVPIQHAANRASEHGPSIRGDLGHHANRFRLQGTDH